MLIPNMHYQLIFCRTICSFWCALDGHLTLNVHCPWPLACSLVHDKMQTSGLKRQSDDSISGVLDPESSHWWCQWCDVTLIAALVSAMYRSVSLAMLFMGSAVQGIRWEPVLVDFTFLSFLQWCTSRWQAAFFKQAFVALKQPAGIL